MVHSVYSDKKCSYVNRFRMPQMPARSCITKRSLRPSCSATGRRRHPFRLRFSQRFGFVSLARTAKEVLAPRLTPSTFAPRLHQAFPSDGIVRATAVPWATSAGPCWPITTKAGSSPPLADDHFRRHPAGGRKVHFVEDGLRLGQVGVVCLSAPRNVVGYSMSILGVA